MSDGAVLPGFKSLKKNVYTSSVYFGEIVMFFCQGDLSW